MKYLVVKIEKIGDEKVSKTFHMDCQVCVSKTDALETVNSYMRGPQKYLAADVECKVFELVEVPLTKVSEEIPQPPLVKVTYQYQEEDKDVSSNTQRDALAGGEEMGGSSI